MLLSAVTVLVVAQSNSEIPERLMNNPVYEKCDLLGYYAASSGNFLPYFPDNVSVSSSSIKNARRKEILTLEDGTDRLSRIVSEKLPLLAAY